MDLDELVGDAMPKTNPKAFRVIPSLGNMVKKRGYLSRGNRFSGMTPILTPASMNRSER